MISFELDSTKNGIELFIDSEGIDELIEYLQFVRKTNDHFHLVAGNELNEEKIGPTNTMISHVKIIYFKIPK